MAGEGWFSYWLKKYGCYKLVSVTDDKSWKVGDIGEFNYLPIVKKQDAVEAVLETKADVVIMSWPYMDDTAFRVWESLEPGTRLVYIGEGGGGCTADDTFFEAVHSHELNDESVEICKGVWLNFEFIHDYPSVYLKP